MLSETQISAHAREVLQEGGYELRVPPQDWEERNEAYLFEDLYSVVGLVVYGTCDELIYKWPEDQGTLSSAISEHIGRGEAKAAEGYLVLLTSGRPAQDDHETLTKIRYDTSHVRKLVATGETLEMKNDVERALRPLLPLRVEQSRSEVSSGLGQLQELLDVNPKATGALIEAYQEQTSLLKALKKYVRSQ